MANSVIASLIDTLNSQIEIAAEVGGEWGEKLLSQPVLLDRGRGYDYELEEWYFPISWVYVTPYGDELEIDYDFGPGKALSFREFIEKVLSACNTYDSDDEDNPDRELKAHRPELEDDDYVIRPFDSVSFVSLEQEGAVGDGMRVCFEF